MGPNGSGKSTLAYVLAGKADYDVTEGEVLLDGEDILAMAPDERAAKGLFLAFQYPLEIPGVATMTFLRTALNAQRKKRGEAELPTPEFIKRVREVAGKLGIDQDMLRRGVNVGFSGGEKKRNEILQMALLEPRLCVLDETDSGLDIDALKVVSEGVNRLRSPDRAFVVITHYQRLLDYIVPDVVHVLSKGRIVKTGGKELALELEATRLRRNTRTRRRERCDERRGPPDQDCGRDRAGERISRTAKRALPGAAAVAALREAAFRRFDARRAAAPARRGVEIHRPARADARCQAARRRARCGGEGARQAGAGALLGGDRGARASCSSTARSCRNCPISPAWKPASPIRSMAQALAGGDPQLVAHLGKLVPTDDVAVALNTAFMGDGAVIRVARGRDARAADPSRLRAMPARSRPRCSSRSLVVIEKGARAMLVESHEGAGRQRVPGQRGARAQGRRRGACRSRQDHRRGRGRAACLDA